MSIENFMGKRTFNFRMKGGQKRVKELIIYILNKCESDPAFGATKLNKILFHSDFRSFETFEKPITGEKYQRLEYGPAPVAMVPVLEEMVEQKIIIPRDNLFHGRQQKRYLATRSADLSLFSGQDIAIIDDVIQKQWGKTGVEVSEETHGIQWATHYNGDLIAYETAFLSDEPITPGDICRTKELAAEFGWNV